MKYDSFDQLIHDESFIEKLNNAATPDEAAAMCAEYGFDLNKELDVVADEELNAEQLLIVPSATAQWVLRRYVSLTFWMQWLGARVNASSMVSQMQH